MNIFSKDNRDTSPLLQKIGEAGFFCYNKTVIVHIINISMSIMALCVVIALLTFMASEIWDILRSSILAPKTRNFLHDVALVLVILKAIRILLFYLSTYRVGMKYLIEIAIIAPTIEIIFAPDRHEWWLLCLFAVFSISNLLIYLFFYQRISTLDYEAASEISAVSARSK